MRVFVKLRLYWKKAILIEQQYFDSTENLEKELNLQDDERSGRPADAVTQVNIARVARLLTVGHNIIYWQTEEILKIGESAVYKSEETWFYYCDVTSKAKTKMCILQDEKNFGASVKSVVR